MKSFLKGFAYAGRGIWFCIRNERNFRIHITASVYVLWLGFSINLTRAEWAALLITIAMVLSSEAVNTAVEKAVDLSSPEFNPLARVAKDAAAAAVLICAAFSVAIGGFLFFRPEFWDLLKSFANQPLNVVLLAVSLVISFLFIKFGGYKIKAK